MSSGRRPAAGRETAAKLIYRALQAEIVAMKLLPGTALNEKTFIEQFGVSRTPVREALIRLAEDGLVDIFPQSGTFVSRIPVDLIPESVVIRQALEGATAEHAALSVTPAAVEKLDELIALQHFHASRNKLDLFHEADDAFHEAIAEIAGFPGIWQHLKLVKIQIDRARRMTVPVLGRMDQVLHEHKSIRDAIVAKDASLAVKAMKHHLSAVLPDIDELRKSHPDYFV
ncbi:MAG: GntR family transcriptional regulator [Brucellaceae bacterium]|nr:GntR family transcriptional regulator [Brucellaceae bacterium]